MPAPDFPPPKAQKPPEKLPDAPKPPPDAVRPVQPDAKGPKDNRVPVEPHPSGDKTAATGHGPVKIDTSPRGVDAPRHGGDQHGVMSPKMDVWQKKFEGQQQRMDGPKSTVAPDVKQQNDRPADRFSTRLDLNDSVRTTPGGPLDMGKVKAQLDGLVKAGISGVLRDHAQHDIGRGARIDSHHYPHGGHTGREVQTKPTEATLHVDHAKTDIEANKVKAMFDVVCKENKVHSVPEARHAPQFDRPDPQPPRVEHRPGPTGQEFNRGQHDRPPFPAPQVVPTHPQQFQTPFPRYTPPHFPGR